MPELPEVNTVKNGFHETVLNLGIEQVEVDDDKILRNVTALQFIDALRGRIFVDTYRQGKYFFAQLDNGYYILFHLGMTGDIIYYTTPEDRPPYERFNIQFKSGLILGFEDVRKFAHILLIKDLADYIKEIRLGPDALLISFEQFKEVFAGRSTTLKAVLLNQRLIAGIGNLYADEICFQSKLHPGSVAGKLTLKQLKKLYTRMQKILDTACKKNAYYRVYPDDWFWKWRAEDGGNFKGKGTIHKAKIAGRTTYWVDGYQKLIS